MASTRGPSCSSCYSTTLIRDDKTGSLVCDMCGLIQEFDQYEAQIGGVSGPSGTFVRHGTTGEGYQYTSRERKLFEADRLINDVILKLGLEDKYHRVKEMISSVTDGEFGTGEWFNVLIGACCYIVMRIDEKVLVMADIASAVSCDVYELGRMVIRVVEHLELTLPEFDIVGLFEKTIRTSPCLEEVDKGDLELMRKQGVFVLQCAVKWFLTTGRRPTPMVAAVLVFVGKLNDVDVKLEVVGKELNVAIPTCRKRYRELLEALVKVGQDLPWGKDINVKNVMSNAPFVIQYMEKKSLAKPSGKKRNFLEGMRLGMEEVVSKCLRKDVEYRLDGMNEGNDSGYFQKVGTSEFQMMSTEELENCKISHESLSTMYTEFLNNVGSIQSASEQCANRGRKRGLYELSSVHEWWSGNSELSRKLLLKQILEKNVGLDVMPPSFVAGCEANERRREKINEAKVRIKDIMTPPNKKSVVEEAPNSVETAAAANKRKRGRREGTLDWEDLIIETLLLHQVKEEEIESGHYNTLLDLYVFNS